MKRIEEGHQRKLYYCHVFREELQDVIDLMTIDGDPPNLVSGSYEFDNAEELFAFLGENGKGEISISRRNPSVRFSGDGLLYATVYTSDPSDASVALFHRVANTLSHCEKQKPLRSRASFSFVAGILLWLGFTEALIHFRSWLVVPFGSLVIIGLAMFVNVFRPRRRRDTVFYGIRRDTRKSFWQRKRDDILANLISAVIGAALGVGGTLLTQEIIKR
ncbi:hypothetical protein [Burkholderia sp. F1]|uniref:hypothetical protein n=1 Tax=Burkholderia sp. F1 TaxID=3366817 RepID=UPI003D70A22A